MEALKRKDAEAQFRFIGGDLMQQAGGTMVRHYRDLAYMGIIPVLLHLPTILKNMKQAKRDIADWQPDVVILVDYPGFNLSIAKYVHSQRLRANGQRPQVYYYIAPKLWAWKEYRIKNIRRDVDELFSILPFEVDFFEGKHHYPIHYVGNPTADEVREFRVHSSQFRVQSSEAQPTVNCELCTVNCDKPLLALLCGSRRQEIEANLPAMLQVADRYSDDYQIVVAGAPAIPQDFYLPFLNGHRATVVFNQTYALLSQAHAALVTSGTATLETALFGVPQVVCYATMMPWLLGLLRRLILKVKYVSLVNLIADREVVPELVADSFSTDNIDRHLKAILHGPAREAQLQGYEEVRRRLGNDCAPDNAADIMIQLLNTTTDFTDDSD
jgi:lipid-A-disaccharide synthase